MRLNRVCELCWFKCSEKNNQNWNLFFFSEINNNVENAIEINGISILWSNTPSLPPSLPPPSSFLQKRKQTFTHHFKQKIVKGACCISGLTRSAAAAAAAKDSHCRTTKSTRKHNEQRSRIEERRGWDVCSRGVYSIWMIHAQLSNCRHFRLLPDSPALPCRYSVGGGGVLVRALM